MTGQQQTTRRQHVAPTSGDVSESQIAKHRGLFPEVFVEGKIDFDKLKIALGAATESDPGRFHFSWAGRDDALSLLQTPSAGTQSKSSRPNLTVEQTRSRMDRGHSPQATGGIERLSETLQARLVKEMRLAGISSCNEWL